ncbi:hypothetical protein LUU34_00832000 [Aix galericulata]|nr:hypothetical protein LUU34_00832000 [Aix galericulata]
MGRGPGPGPGPLRPRPRSPPPARPRCCCCCCCCRRPLPPGTAPPRLVRLLGGGSGREWRRFWSCCCARRWRSAPCCAGSAKGPGTAPLRSRRARGLQLRPRGSGGLLLGPAPSCAVGVCGEGSRGSYPQGGPGRCCFGGSVREGSVGKDQSPPERAEVKSAPAAVPPTCCGQQLLKGDFRSGPGGSGSGAQGCGGCAD